MEPRPAASTFPAGRSSSVDCDADAPFGGTLGYDIDDVAVAARARRRALAAGERVLPICDACGAPITGEVAGRGLLLFPRGDGVAREEPPLCDSCALAIGITALWRFAEEEEEG
jgi:hypothetical protein